MVLDVTTATGAMSGSRYIESLKDGREVWLDGAKVMDVTTHPDFTGMVHELARIYDLQQADGGLLSIRNALRVDITLLLCFNLRATHLRQLTL